jgi:8-oxo-dGTP pyrophosphatase MutT (NUDIX family)
MIKSYRPAVFIVTYARTEKGIEYVLLKRKLHWKGWEFPKGGIEKSEIKEKTVRRELKEETGLNALKIRSWPINGKYVYDIKTQKERKYLGQTYSLFSAEVKKSKIKVDKQEHDYGKWVTFKEAMKKLTWSNQRKCLKTVNHDLTHSQ